MANIEALYVGAKLYFVRYSAGTADKDNKPDDTAFTAAPIGAADRVRIQIEHQRREIIKPAPGRRRLVDVIHTGEVERLEITLRDITPVFWEMITGSGELTSGTDVDYSAWSAGPEIKGWLKLQYADAEDTVQHVADRYVTMRIEEVPIEDGEIQYTIHADVLYSTQNSGSIHQV